MSDAPDYAKGASIDNLRAIREHLHTLVFLCEVDGVEMMIRTRVEPPVSSDPDEEWHVEGEELVMREHTLTSLHSAPIVVTGVAMVDASNRALGVNRPDDPYLLLPLQSEQVPFRLTLNDV